MSFDLSQYNGVVCTLDQLQQSNQLYAPIHCLTRGQSIGLAMSAVASFISLTAVLVVFALIIRNCIQHMRTSPSGSWRLIRNPMDLYILSLFFSNLLQSIGTTLDVRWLHTGVVENGVYCTAQGTIQQLGETGVAMSTCAIAVHTFVVVWWGKGTRSLRIALAVVSVIWLFILLYVGIGAGVHRNASYETPTPYWCWIGPHFLKEEITGEYLWFWVTLGVSTFVYISLYFWSRGNVTVDPDRWWRFTIHRATPANNPRRGRAFLVMLVYPLVYCVIILPVSVVRFIEFVQESKGNHNGVSSQATLIVNFIFELSGVLDVLLFFFTRTGLLLFSQPVVTAGRAPSLSPNSSEKGPSRRHSDVIVHDSDHPALSGRLPSDEDNGWDLPQLDDATVLQS